MRDRSRLARSCGEPAAGAGRPACIFKGRWDKLTAHVHATSRHRDGYHHVVERDRRARLERLEASDEARASIVRERHRRKARRLRLYGGLAVLGLLGAAALRRWTGGRPTGRKPDL
jgi:hypothetical protein